MDCQMSHKQQSYAISLALNELEKFAVEVDSLMELVQTKFATIFSDSKTYKLGDIVFETAVTDSGWFYEWKGFSAPVMTKKSSVNAKGHLSFQFSFTGASTQNQLNPDFPNGMPLVHVSFFGGAINDDNIHMFFPIDISTEGINCRLELDQNNSLIRWSYVNEFYWSYSVPLLSINASNIDTLLIEPASTLLHASTEEVVLSEAFNQTVIRYPNLESISLTPETSSN